MTRIIKFRGRDASGTWFFGDLHQWSNGEVYIGVHSSVWTDDGMNSQSYPSFNEIDPDTVGQFTGLYDKNDKEIYEGDIIAVNGRQIGYIVGGVRGYCYDVIYTPAKSNGEKAWPLYSVVTRDYPNKCEVIGNIHDNPELLKED